MLRASDATTDNVARSGCTPLSSPPPLPSQTAPPRRTWESSAPCGVHFRNLARASLPSTTGRLKAERGRRCRRCGSGTHARCETHIFSSHTSRRGGPAWVQGAEVEGGGGGPAASPLWLASAPNPASPPAHRPRRGAPGLSQVSAEARLPAVGALHALCAPAPRHFIGPARRRFARARSERHRRLAAGAVCVLLAVLVGS